MKRITQVKTNSPMKTLFCGLISNVILLRIQISKSEAQTTRLETTQRYFNKLWDLSPVNDYRLEGGSFVSSSITNRLSSWIGSPSCSEMYSWTISSVMVPELTARYPLAQTWRPQYCFRRCSNSCSSTLELVPFNHCTILLTLWCG